MSCGVTTTVAHAFRRTVLPLAAYYGITLVVPLANGAEPASAAFLRHALVVLVVPPLVIVLASIVHAIGRMSLGRR